MAYVVPPLLRDGPVELIASVVIAVPVMVLIAEVSADELLRGLSPGDAVIMIDVDHFKEVNDRQGHAAGDHVLVELGALLRRVIRDADLVARYGGEEFVVVARDAAGEARAVAERIAAAWRRLPDVPTLSLGVAVHDAAEPATETLRRAAARCTRRSAPDATASASSERRR